jgi:hypothetical protein
MGVYFMQVNIVQGLVYTGTAFKLYDILSLSLICKRTDPQKSIFKIH